ncbi:dipeptide transporter ATP-binding subunit [compost metagenome]
MSAVPTVKGGRESAARRVRLMGDPPSPVNPPPGCRFAGRCPAAQPDCSPREPELREVVPGHRVACHYVAVRDGALVAPLAG